MSRTPMQSFNLLLMTIGITMAILIAVTLIILIWIGLDDFGETGARLVGSASVLLAAVFLNWGVNSILGRSIGQLFPTICYAVTMLCIYGGFILSLLAIWGGSDGDFMIKAILTLVVLFVASLIALVVSAVVQSSRKPPLTD